MSYELGKAYVQIIPSLKGMNATISKELGGVDNAVKSRTNAWSASISGALGSAFKGVALVGGAAMAGLTVAVGSYIPEALRASDATDKFKQTLNFAGIDGKQIEQLTRQTRDYADKTVYSLSDIQSITAQLAANNVKNFDQLAQAAGNLNAVAGGNAETFKRVGLVLTQTAGAGKLTTENWNQLADAIPGASGRLQEAMLNAGAYTGNFRDAMAQGQITAEEFNDALMQLGFEEVAAKAATSTATIEGAWGNLEAAVVGGLADAITELKPAIAGALSGLAEKVTATGEQLTVSVGNTVTAVKGIVGTLQTGMPTLDLVKTFGADGTPIVLASVQKLKASMEDTGRQADVLKSRVSVMFSPLKDSAKITAGVIAVSAALSEAAGWAAEFANAALPMVRNLTSAAGILGGGIVSAVRVLAPALGDLAVAWQDAASHVSVLFIPAAQAASALMLPLARVAAGLAEGIAALPAPVLEAVVAFTALQRISKATIFTGLIASVKNLGGVLAAPFNQAAQAWQAGLTPLSTFKIGLAGVGGAAKSAGLALKTAFISNPVGIALTALTSAIAVFASKSAEAKQRQEDLAATLDKTTGAATEQTTAWLTQDEEVQKMVETYTELGGSASDVYAAIMGNDDALNTIRDTIQANQSEWDIAVGRYTYYASDIQALRRTIEDQGEAVRETSEAVNDATGGYTRQAEAIQGVIDAQQRFIDKQKAATDTQFAADDAAATWVDGLTEYQDALARNAGSIEKNKTALNDYADKALDVMSTQQALGVSHDELNTKVAELGGQIKQAAIDMGMSEQEAQAYIEQLGLVPDSVLTEAKLETADAMFQLGEFKVEIDSTSGTVTINGNKLPAQTTLAEFVGETNVANGTVTINGNQLPASMTLNDFIAGVNTSSGTSTIYGDKTRAEAALGDFVAKTNATGAYAKIYGTDYASSVASSIRTNIANNPVYLTIKARYEAATNPYTRGAYYTAMNRYADGGVLRPMPNVSFFAGGSEKHVAQIAPAGAWRVWAEPETGGEAYIPLALSKRARSVEILEEVAQRFGYRLLDKRSVLYEAGGVNGGRGFVESPAGVVFNIGSIVNPVAEPSSTSLAKELQRVAGGQGLLV